VYDGHTHVPYASLTDATATHTVTAVSASKAWNLPGLKCAQLVLSNDADAARWEKVGFMAEHGAANPGVVANIAAYEAGGPWLADVLTYLAWLDCRRLALGDHPAEYLLAHAGVALTDGPACGVAGAGFARLNLATPRPVLEQKVARLADALARRQMA